MQYFFKGDKAMQTPEDKKKGYYKLALVLFFVILLAFLMIVRQYAQKQSRDKIRLAGVQVLRAELEQYYLNHHRYPAAIYSILEVENSRICQSALCLSELPLDPLSQTAYDYQPCPGQDFNGCQAGLNNARGYTITYILESRIGGIKAGYHLASPRGLCSDSNCRE
jgi:hypothetical protein